MQKPRRERVAAAASLERTAVAGPAKTRALLSEATSSSAQGPSWSAALLNVTLSSLADTLPRDATEAPGDEPRSSSALPGTAGGSRSSAAQRVSQQAASSSAADFSDPVRSRKPDRSPRTPASFAGRRRAASSANPDRRRRRASQKGLSGRVLTWEEVFASDAEAKQPPSSTLPAAASVSAGPFCGEELFSPQPLEADSSKPPHMQEGVPQFRLFGRNEALPPTETPPSWGLRWFASARVGSLESANCFSRRMRRITASANISSGRRDLPPAPLLRSARVAGSDLRLGLFGRLKVAIIGGGLAGLR